MISRLGSGGTGLPIGAANRLGLSLSAYWRRKTGRARVSAQTVLLAMYTEVHLHNWLDIAALAADLAKLNAPRL